MATRKPFEIEREIAAAKAAYHEAALTDTEGERIARHAVIKKLSNELSDLYTKGAVERPEGVKPTGIKKGLGVYEVGNLNGLRSRGETPDEAVQNWNDGVFIFSDGPSVSVGKAEE